MKVLRKSVGAFLLLASTSIAAQGADPQPKRAPVPAWVQPVAIPASDPKLADSPIQVLKLEGQTKFDAKGTDTYFEMVI